MSEFITGIFLVIVVVGLVVIIRLEKELKRLHKLKKDMDALEKKQVDVEQYWQKVEDRRNE